MADRKVSVTLDARVGPYLRGLGTASAATRAWARELETSESRMSSLVQAGLALGPTFVPLGATVTPVLTSLTSQLGFAAAAAGVTVAAFNGVGDALDALNKYQLDPTAANLAELEIAMGKLPESAREFVRFTDSELMPALDRLQDVAADGVLPGAQSGIEDLMTRLPQFRDLVAEVADTTGDLMADTGASVASGEWDEFLDYLTREARPTLESLADTVGNVFEGVADSLIALDPVTDSVTDGIEGLTERWAELDPSDYAEFVEYLERVGPKVADTLAATAGAIGALTAASAPVGEVALPVIEALAVGLEAVAESPAGPALIGAAAGISALSRGVALYNAANGSALMGLLDKGGAKGKLAGAGFRSAGAGLGVLALSMTDLDDSLGISNTAMFAMMGLLGGPWGAAIGGAVGAMKDLEAATDGAAESSDEIERILDRVDAGGAVGASGIEKLADEIERLKAARDDLGMFSAGVFGDGPTYDQITEKIRIVEDALADASGQFGATRVEGMLLSAMNPEILSTSDALDTATASAQEFHESLAELNAFLEGRASLRDYEAALDDFTEGLKENGKSFDINLEKGRANQENLDAIASDALRYAETLKGIERVEFLDATADQFRQLVKEGKAPRNQVREILAVLEELGASRPTAKPGVDTDEANGELTELEQRLDRYGLTTKNATAALDDLASGRIDSVQGLIDKYGMTKAQAQALLIDHATGRIAGINARLDSLNRSVTSSVYVNTYEQRTILPAKNLMSNRRADNNADGGFYESGVRQFADGGFGTNGRYYPREPMIVPGGANILWGEKETGWEAYISGKPGMEDRNLAIWRETGERLGALETFANGGSRGTSSTRAMSVSEIRRLADRGRLRALDRLEIGFKKLERAADTSADALDRERDQRKKWVDRRNELSSTVTSRFRSDIFATDGGDPWADDFAGGSFGDVLGSLRGDIREANQFRDATRTLRRKGLDNGALRALLESGDAVAFSQLGRDQLAQYQQLYAQRQRVTGAVGDVAGNVLYADEVRQQTREIKDSRRELQAIKKTIREEHREDRRASKRGAGRAARGRR